MALFRQQRGQPIHLVGLSRLSTGGGFSFTLGKSTSFTERLHRGRKHAKSVASLILALFLSFMGTLATLPPFFFLLACRWDGDVANQDTDTSIVATSIYTIALEFNSLAGSIWVVLAYTLAFLSSRLLPLLRASLLFRQLMF